MYSQLSKVASIVNYHCCSSMINRNVLKKTDIDRPSQGITYKRCCCKTLLHFIVTLTTINMAVLVALSTFCLISIYSSTADKVFNGKGEIYFTHNYPFLNSGIRVVYRPKNYEDCKLVNYLKES